MTISPYDRDLDRNSANCHPLTPLTFLERAAAVFPDRRAIVHGALRRTYRDFYAPSRRLASAPARRGFSRGDTIAVMLANTPAMLERRYGVPMRGAALDALGTRLDAAALAFMLDHGEARALIVDRGFSAVVGAAPKIVKTRPRVIDYDDPEHDGPGARLGAVEYESLLAEGDGTYDWLRPNGEWGAISLNYASGATGDPKGVVYHHRGASLLAVGNTVTADIGGHPAYVWTLPMFLCNGWRFPWSIGVKAGVHVCLRQVRAKALYDLIVAHGVTHLCGAPIVMSILLGASVEEKRPLPHVVRFFIAAAPPPAAVLAATRKAGFGVRRHYGLTEVCGPAVVNDWKEQRDALDAPAQAALKARQGVRCHALESVDVMDPETMLSVPADGERLGQAMLRGNVVMKGHRKNKALADEAFAGGWLHSGDLGVKRPDGYVQLKDRSKDIIICGGENISSIEVEDALFRRPGVPLAAVVARPDDKSGETPCALMAMNPGQSATEEEPIAWRRARLARYKRPRHIVFAEILKTSTGKVRKFALREQARTVGEPQR